MMDDAVMVGSPYLQGGIMISQEEIFERFEQSRRYAYELFDEAIQPTGIRAVAEKIGGISVRMEPNGLDRAALMREIGSFVFRHDRGMEWTVMEVCGESRPEIILTGYTTDILRGQ